MRNPRIWMSVVVVMASGAMGAAGCIADESAGDELETSSAESNLTATDLISGLDFVMTTGNDDKRSDSNVTIAVNIRNPSSGSPQTLSVAAGLGQTWSNNSVHSVRVAMPYGTHDADISSFTVSWHQGGAGGWSADNWNLQQLQVVANDTTIGQSSTQMSLAANPFFRFTGSATSFQRSYVK